MSNIARVIEFVKSEPNYDKDQMVSKIMESLSVTKSNAQVYLYNATKKLGSNVPVKTSKTKVVKSLKTIRAEIVQKSDEEIARIKEERLNQMKSIGKRRRSDEEQEREAKKTEMLAENDSYMEDSKAYLDSLTTLTRKFLLGAE
jgi:chorismate mutase